MQKIKSKLISVIVPVYNQEKFIGRCMRSLLALSLSKENFDIIVIDDGSKDKTSYVLDKFKKDINIITNKSNLGLPKALNIGIKSARTPFIVRVDSDDYVNAEFLNQLLLYIENNNYMDAVACDYLIVDDEGNSISRNNCIKDPIACGIIFRIEQLIEIGLYDESFLLHEERDLRYRFNKKYKIHRLELPLYRYRMHNDNSTNNKKNLKYFEKRLKDKHGSKIKVS